MTTAKRLTAADASGPADDIGDGTVRSALDDTDRRQPSQGGPVVASWRTMTGFGASYAIASLG